MSFIGRPLSPEDPSRIVRMPGPGVIRQTGTDRGSAPNARHRGGSI